MYLALISFTLVSGSSESVAPICIIVVGRHRLVEASEQSPCNIDGICLEAVCGASVHGGVEKVFQPRISMTFTGST
jgi:hypothetical protein